MTKHRAIITIRVPDTPEGRFLFEVGACGPNDERGTTVHGAMTSTVTMGDFFAGMKSGTDVEAYRLTAAPSGLSGAPTKEGFLTWITDLAIQNANPLSRILDIEDTDGVITRVDGWDQWDKGMADVTARFPNSTTALSETAMIQIVIHHLLHTYELDGKGYEAHLFHQGTLTRGQIAQRVEDDWNAVEIHGAYDEEDTLAKGTVAQKQKAPTELILRLISAATFIDDIAGIKERHDSRQTYLGKVYAAQHSDASGERYYPVISLEQHPRKEASVIIKGWLFSFIASPDRGDKNAKTDFIRSLIEVSKVTFDKAQLHDPAIYSEIVAAFDPRKGRVSVKIDEPGALRAFFLGDLLTDLGEERAEEIVEIWQQSADEVDLVKAAMAYQRSSVVQIMGQSDLEPSEEAPEEDTVPVDEAKTVDQAEPGDAEEQSTDDHQDTSEAEVKEQDTAHNTTAPPVTEKEPSIDDEQPVQNAEPPKEEPALAVDNPQLLKDDIEALRTEGKIKPDTRYKKIKDRLIRAGEAEVFVEMGELAKILDEAGFTIVESTAKGLRVTIPNDPKTRNLFGSGSEDVFFPAFHANATCKSLKASAVIGLIFEAIAHPIFGSAKHWPRALMAALKSTENLEEKLAALDGGCTELLKYRFLEWVLSQPDAEETPPPTQYLADTLGDASAVMHAMGIINEAVNGSSNDDDDATVFDQATQIWTGDLKSGRAFYDNADQPPSSEEIPT